MKKKETWQNKLIKKINSDLNLNLPFDSFIKPTRIKTEGAFTHVIVFKKGDGSLHYTDYGFIVSSEVKLKDYLNCKKLKLFETCSSGGEIFCDFIKQQKFCKNCNNIRQPEDFEVKKIYRCSMPGQLQMYRTSPNNNCMFWTKIMRNN